jgi:hypothetical protein
MSRLVAREDRPGDQLRDPRGRAVRPPRAERGRQDDNDQDADHAADPDLGDGACARARRRQGCEVGATALGYVFGGDRGLYERLSALDNLRYFAELYGVDPKVQRGRIDEPLSLVGLTGREKERVEGYSRGMRQRLHIARGILHDPPVVFLDEPTIGVDPVGARELRSSCSSPASTCRSTCCRGGSRPSPRDCRSRTAPKLPGRSSPARQSSTLPGCSDGRWRSPTWSGWSP